ncbi:MAG: hypothetical protein WBE72_12515 [Terracidiphilus sp.]
MGLFRRPAKEERAGIVFPASMAYWFAYCTYRVDRNRLHPNEIDLAGAITLGLLSGAAWLVTTPTRLRELSLSKLWMFPLVIPFAASIFALWRGWSVIGWVLLVIAAMAQWVLVFLAPRKGSGVPQSESSGEPSA